jgi:hypothetical protein
VSLPVVFIKSTRDFMLYTTFTQSLLWASSGKLFLLAPVVSLLYVVGSRVLLHNLHVPSCNFCSLDFSSFLAYVWQLLILSQHLGVQLKFVQGLAYKNSKTSRSKTQMAISNRTASFQENCSSSSAHQTRETDAHAITAPAINGPESLLPKETHAICRL